MPNFDPRDFDSRYEITRQDYTDREDARLIFQPWDEGNVKFLGSNHEYDNEVDLIEMNNQRDYEIYNS